MTAACDPAIEACPIGWPEPIIWLLIVLLVALVAVGVPGLLRPIDRDDDE